MVKRIATEWLWLLGSFNHRDRSIVPLIATPFGALERRGLCSCRCMVWPFLSEPLFGLCALPEERPAPKGQYWRNCSSCAYKKRGTCCVD